MSEIDVSGLRARPLSSLSSGSTMGKDNVAVVKYGFHVSGIFALALDQKIFGSQDHL